ncbi:MAG: efflux RND transporter periplasmic adaptor subunit [Pseudomonadota bacterium]
MTPFRHSLLLALWLSLTACGGEGPENANNDEDEDETPPVPVEVTTPERGDIFAVYSGTAPIEAFAEADVVAKVAGEVRLINVEEGDAVTRGQVLAQLDGDRLRLELNESQANLSKLQRDLERNKDLRARDLISEGDFEKIQYDMEALEASFNLAKLELDYTYIRAPIDGVVSERMVKLGNTIQEGEALFRVTSLDPLVTYLFVPEREYRRIRAGQPVGIEIDALPDERIVASVTRVSPIVDPETGTFKITVEISDPERRVKPGMFGRIAIVYDQRENALKIPRSALLEESLSTSVFIVEDGTARRREVETGYSDRGMVEILAGLGDDDRIVTVGQIGLKEDSKVNIINARADNPGNNREALDAAEPGTETTAENDAGAEGE